MKYKCCVVLSSSPEDTPTRNVLFNNLHSGTFGKITLNSGRFIVEIIFYILN
ncbi:MAG: hypothetical protein ACEY3B_04365 [Wolbachia sp.]